MKETSTKSLGEEVSDRYERSTGERPFEKAIKSYLKKLEKMIQEMKKLEEK